MSEITEAEASDVFGVEEPFDSNDDGHCGNDCGGTSSNDGTGERYDAEDCQHCECCCFCVPCQYARVA